ncbi:MAG: type IV pilus twitching motility protein PilT [Nitrospiraceae bacterium]|nr:MAG: type IV pilus twitching motility protein PilT [Nitrospiraceae bacterium]
MSVDINEILRRAVRKKASDVHIKAGSYPIIRINGDLRELRDEPRLTPEDTAHISRCVLSESQQEEFSRSNDMDIAYGVTGLGRFRCNCHVQRGTVGLVFRFIPLEILDIEELSLPVVLKKIAMEPRGLILVTGTTGSGKSTTLASMIDYINTNKSANIVTIEDPIEFLHRDKKSIVSQREVGNDTETFAKALRAALRQDPDVILVGEMRDFETVKTALDAAETGHLVVSTLHTIDATETINRIISVFPPYQHHQVRAQLSSVLRATISMRLVPRADTKGMVPAVEILLGTATIKACIEDPDKTKLIRDYIAEGVSQYGMQTFDQSLFGLLQKDFITYEEAVSRATNPDDFALRVKGVTSTRDVWGAGGDISREARGKGESRIERSTK